MSIDAFHSVIYADDTSFYATVFGKSNNAVIPASEQTVEWSTSDHMILNTKTVITNFLINHLYVPDDPIDVRGTQTPPSQTMKFLGLAVDNHLTFNSHIDFLVQKCSSK